jgi:hypothetical protein
MPSPSTIYPGVMTSDAIQKLGGAPIVLVSASGAIDPHTPNRYFINKAGVAALTLAAPTAGADDGLTLLFNSTTANAHTITATGLLKTGSANVNVATFAAQAGAGLTLIAFNGLWYVDSANAITFS